MRSAERLVVTLGALLVALLAGAAPAYAHAALVRAEPGAGSVICSGPGQVLLTFSEDVLLSDDSVRVLDPSGHDVERGTAHHTADGAATAAVALRPGLAHGTYTVAWRVVSADTHPVSGAFTFSVGAPSRTSAVLPQRQAGGGPAGVLYGIGRWVAYGGFAVLVGASAFLAGCWPRGARQRVMQRLAVGGWTALTAATLALLLLRGPYVAGTGLSGVLDLTGLRAAVTTGPGEALVARLLLMAVAAVFLSVLFGAYARREDPAERRDLGFGLATGGTVVAVGIALTWAASEHASVGLQPSVAMPVDVLHLLAMAVWLGGLAALLTALYRAPGIEAAAVRRFSRVAFTSVCLLVATGVYQSWRQVGSWGALTGTSYGRLLMAKVALVAVLVGIAGFSRRWTGRLGEAAAAGQSAESTPAEAVEVAAAPPAPAPAPARATAPAPDPATAPATADPVRAAQLARQQAAFATARARRQRDADPVRAGLRRSVLAEAVVAVAVLAVTTALSGSEPARTAAAAAAGTAAPAASGGPATVTLPYDTGGAHGRGTAVLHLDPARTGANQLHMILTDPAGRPVDVPEVDLEFTLRSRRIGPLTVPLTHAGTGEWTASALQLPVPGRWQVALTVRTSDIDEVTETGTVTIEQG